MSKRRVLLGLLIIPVLIFLAFSNAKGQIVKTPFVTYLIGKVQQITTGVDKTDPKWMRSYCSNELKKLPTPPFKYTGLNGDIHFGITDVSLKKFIPQEKFLDSVTCGYWYKYNPKDAYASVGVEYIFDIKYSNAFKENVDRLYTESIQKTSKTWKKSQSLSDNEGGRPFYGYKGFPLIFSREISKIGTEEFININWGANELFVQFTVYEK